MSPYRRTPPHPRYIVRFRGRTIEAEDFGSVIREIRRLGGTTEDVESAALAALARPSAK